MHQRENEDGASLIIAFTLGQVQRRWPLARVETLPRLLKVIPGEIRVVCYAFRDHGLPQQVNLRQAFGLTSKHRCLLGNITIKQHFYETNYQRNTYGCLTKLDWAW